MPKELNMKQEQWEKINLVMEKIFAIEPNARKDFLKNTDLDEETLDEIRSLLAFEDEAEDFMSLSANDISDKILLPDEFKQTSLIGLKIGVYEIKQELGLGGMGAVYLGERTDGKFSQKVAIKMLRREFNIERIRGHFRREREIQAKLVHPNIAALLDAGTTDDNIPYLVMEYVEGIQIDKFCSENNLELNERLKLFNKVCEAVSFAHQNLVIHRDIKPSNIIITNEGQPKLLDFGISKLIDESGENSKTITQIGAMTPEFASPEQIKGESVTTATDIYSLGVVLFKLLTGTMPHDATDLSNSELFQEITQAQPTTPSAAADTNPQSAIRSPQLKGDLDNIILKALRKEPERRYRTVEQFSADLWRFIDNLPVTARPATFSYQASKFYQRNKIQVFAGFLIVLSLLTGITAAVWQASVAREQARIAAVEEERAKKITGFMEKIISYANPASYAEGFESGGEAKVIEVLNKLSDQIENEFPNRPDIQSELHNKFAEVYVIRYNNFNKAPDREKALRHARRALELRRKFYGENHELVAKDMYYLVASRDKFGDSDQEELAKIFAEAIKMMREANPKNLNLAYMLQDYSNRLRERENSEIYFRNALPAPQTDRLALAESYLTESNKIFLNHYPEDNGVVIRGKCHLAMVQTERGNFEQANRNFTFCRKGNFSERTIKEIDKYAEMLEKGLQQ